MPSAIVPESPLYDLTTAVDQSANALQISPQTFKSMVGVLLDVVLDQQVPAWIWVKLPKGESWQMEVDRLVTDGDRLKGLCLLRSAVEELDPTEASRPATSFVESMLLETELRNAHTTVQLAADTALKGEFLVAVWAPGFSAMLTAQRGRLRKSSLTEAVTPTSELSEAFQEESGERRAPLFAQFQFERGVVQRSIQQLVGLLASESVDLVGPTPYPQLQADWTSALAQTATQSELDLASLLLGKHIQRQEELWQRAMVHRKQAELVNVLQLQNEELTNTVRSKDEFISTIGQELRTPLTNMKTALTLLNSPNLKPPQRQRYMELLTKECDRQSSLIGSLLDLVSLDQMAERKTLEPIKLSDVVPGVVSTYQPLAEEKGVRLAYTIPEDLPAVANLGAWLRQIVVNLIHNGIKFTPAGGQVWVRAKQQGDYIQLEFKDSGIGVPVNEIPKIFDRFYRVRQSNGDDSGAGLGLTIVQQLLLRCGGSISVKSRPNEGSIFNVLLPVYQVNVPPAFEHLGD
ncbi:MAG: histidine kinase [Alkalinema sp. RU_4_3]|nr:histidine kinase [Alkalinema sp. RU_4_3]